MTEVRSAIAALDDVVGLCELHVWTLTSGIESLSAHVIVEQHADDRQVLREVRATILQRFGIEHVTVQIEPPNFDEPDVAF
ncbi:MAG: cation transporter [Rhodothermales bacterium]|nr:cation transporter [Rhodothermales bacterium]